MSSTRMQGCYPEAGTSKVGDKIRKRRGERGITALDAVLLNNPDIAAGWNSLLGAIRTKNSLPEDGREIIILRVAAINGAAYEWMHHEKVGQDAGLTLAQLKRIRDIDTPLDDDKEAQFSPLQRALLALADSLTRDCVVPDQTWAELRQELESDQARQSRGVTVEQQLMEASVTASAYNMVSRFLRATDVTGAKDHRVPHPE